MSHIKQYVAQDIFFQKGLILLENGKAGFFCFLRVGEAVNMLKVYYQFHIEAGWLTVLNYCTMCHTGRKTPTRQQRFESSGSKSVFNFLCLFGWTVLTLSLSLNWKYYLFSGATEGSPRLVRPFEKNLNLTIIGPIRTLKIQGFDHK